MNGTCLLRLTFRTTRMLFSLTNGSNASEMYFFKMLMKADTQIGFGEEFIALDWREDGAFKPVVEG